MRDGCLECQERQAMLERWKEAYAYIGDDMHDMRIGDGYWHALTAINGGKPLPIWTGSGEWTRLNTHDWSEATKNAGEAGYGIDALSFEEAICPVKIWRYRKD